MVQNLHLKHRAGNKEKDPRYNRKYTMRYKLEKRALGRITRVKNHELVKSQDDERHL